MRGEVERNRLETHLCSERREEEATAFYEEIGSGSRSLIARGASLAMALFR